MRKLTAAICLSALLASTSMPAKPRISKPIWVKIIPPSFHGGWDEDVADGCSGREARYALHATTVHEFEVLSHVKRVRLTGPRYIAIEAVLDKSFGAPELFTWRFEKVPSGLSHPGGNGQVFLRCPKGN